MQAMKILSESEENKCGSTDAWRSCSDDVTKKEGNSRNEKEEKKV